MALDMDKRSKVINLSPWTISFTLPNSNGEIKIDANKATTINNGELVTMADNNDVMLCGTGNGSHARLYVDNPEFREYVGFENAEEKTKQQVLIAEECEKIMSLKTTSAFEKNLRDKVVLYHEKAIFTNYCKKNRFNDHEKIELLEKYTGIKY